MRRRQAASRRQPTGMKKHHNRTKGRSFAYPDQTNGSELAARIRKEANVLTERERSDLLKRGMQIIYGGPG